MLPLFLLPNDPISLDKYLTRHRRYKVAPFINEFELGMVELNLRTHSKFVRAKGALNLNLPYMIH